MKRAEVHEFTTCRDLIGQLMASVVCSGKDAPQGIGKGGWDKSFLLVTDIEIMWRDDEDLAPTKIFTLGQEMKNARRVMSTLQQRGWKDIVKLIFETIDS